MLGVCCALSLIFGNYSNVEAQCTNTIPFGTAIAPTLGTPLTISTCVYLEEYSTIDAAQAGTTYAIAVAAAAGNGYVTVRTGSPSGAVLAQGVSPLSVTPTITGTLFAHWNVNATCATETGICRVATITCTSCAPVPGCVNGLQWPPSVVAVNQGGVTTPISTCVFQTEYSVVSGIQNGRNYTVSAIGNDAAAPAYITVRTGSQAGAIRVQGLSPVSFTANNNDNVFIHYNVDAACATATVCNTAAITCNTCTPVLDCLGVPNGPALPGTACNDNNPNTINDVYQANCTCAGTIAPANDLCAGAININCGGTATGNTANASADIAPFCGASDGTGGGVWYRHIATSNNTVRASLCGSTFDSQIRIFSGSCGVGLVCVAGNDDNFTACASSASEVEFSAVAGTQYWILVHGWSSAVGNFTLNLTCNVVVPIDCNGVPNGPAVPGSTCDDGNPGTINDVLQANCTCAGVIPPPVPANDNPCTAAVIACGASASGTTLSATASTVASPVCATGGLFDVFYSLNVVAGTEYTVTVNGADYDGVLVLYTGACAGPLTEIACADNGFTDNIAEVITFTAAATETILIRTYDWSANNGSFDLSVAATGGCPSVGCNVDGGTIATTNSTSVCVGTGSPKTITVTLTGAVGPNGIWALTQTNGDVVATRPNNALFNLDIYPPGAYRIAHMRYDNTVVLTGITNPSQLTGCFDISNLLTVNLSAQPNGGTISTTSPTTVCVGNGVADIVSVTRTGLVGAGAAYGVLRLSTNTIVASQGGPNFNFDGFAPGVYRIYSIAFQAGATVAGVTTPSGLAGCFDLSNFIQVTANSCTPASLTSSPNPTAGQSFVTFSVANEEYTTVEVYDMSGRQITSLFNQVVESGVEYRLEFDGQNLPNGIYIYRLTTGSEVLIEKFMIAK